MTISMTSFPLRGLFAKGHEAATPLMHNEYARNVVVLALGVCIVALLDISDVTLAFVGALAFMVYGNAARPVRKTETAKPFKVAESSLQDLSQMPFADSAEPRYAAVRRERRERNQSALLQRQQIKPEGAEEISVSVCPVVCPSFASVDWEGQVDEFLCELMPSDETEALARNISCAVQDALRPVFPNVDVIGFAHGNPKSSKAFATAVPDVEIVAKMDPADMAKGIGWRYQGSDMKCLQKAAIRACTDQLAYGDFKFRRSAFKFDEPKVTLSAPAALEFTPFDLSVNSLTPMRHGVLLKACFEADRRAWELILLVHRWARDRGISHAAKGYLTPYAWSLVVLFFLQVRGQDEGLAMPAFSPSPPHFQQTLKNSKKARSTPEAGRTHVASLFKEFMTYCSTELDWCRDVISVKKASRVALAPEKDALPWRRQTKGLEICDPFEPTANLGGLLSNEGRARLCEEFMRAKTICSQDGLLSQLLEPWAPEPADAACKPTTEESKVKNIAPPMPSLRGSLTASPVSISLRPSGASSQPGAAPITKGKVSLTAAPWRQQLKPSSTHNCGSETESTQSGMSSSAPSSDGE